jgi:hypothetical protein
MTTAATTAAECTTSREWQGAEKVPYDGEDGDGDAETEGHHGDGDGSSAAIRLRLRQRREGVVGVSGNEGGVITVGSVFVPLLANSSSSSPRQRRGGLPRCHQRHHALHQLRIHWRHPGVQVQRGARHPRHVRAGGTATSFTSSSSSSSSSSPPSRVSCDLSYEARPVLQRQLVVVRGVHRCWEEEGGGEDCRVIEWCMMGSVPYLLEGCVRCACFVVVG